MKVDLSLVGAPRRSPRPRHLAVLVLVAMLVALAPGLQQALSAHEGHGVVRSVPAEKSLVTTPPEQVLVEFEGEVIASSVDFVVLGAAGKDITTGAPVVDGGTVTVPVRTQVPDGVHRIVFNVNTRTPDGNGTHRFDGSIRYTLSTTGCESRVRSLEFYTSIRRPDFGAAPDRVAMAVPDKTFSQLIYATNGRELHRTTDEGCTWEPILDLAELDDQTGQLADAVIAEILTPREAPGMVTVLVLDPLPGGLMVQPRVFWTLQPGGALVEGGVGLPPLNLDPQLPLRCRHPQPCDIAVSGAGATIPSLWLAAQAAVALPSAGDVPTGIDVDVFATQVFRSDDAGANFQLTSVVQPPADVTATGLVGFPDTAVTIAPDPVERQTVWLGTGPLVWVSNDLGQEFQQAHDVGGSEGRVVTNLDAGLGRDQRDTPRRDLLLTTSSAAPDAQLETIERLLVVGTNQLVGDVPIDVTPMGPVSVESVVRGPQPDQYLVLPRRPDRVRPGAWELEGAAAELRDLDKFELTPWRGASWANPLCPRWFAHDDDFLYLVDADDGHLHVHDAGQFCDQPEGSLGGSSVAVPKFPSVDVPVDGSAALGANPPVVQVAPGQVATIAASLAKAAQDTPLDLAFLIDTSGSMRDNIEQVRGAFDQIVKSLTEQGIDAWFGLGEFNDLSVRYRRLSDIVPPDAGFSRALSEMQVKSGDKEPHLTALHQLLTGEGLQATQGASVPPGLDMHFRPGAVKIVLMASDEAFFDDPDGPEFTQVVEAFTSREVMHVGMHIPEEAGPSNNTAPGVDNPAAGDQLLQQMRELSTATGGTAVAPVDCNADGINDLNIGDPIVCTFSNDVSATRGLASSEALARAIVDVVEAVEDRKALRLEARPTPGFTATPLAFGLDGIGNRFNVDVTLPVRRRWTVATGCLPAAEGTRASFPLNAYLGDRLVATTSIQVLCGAQPVLGAPAAPRPVGVALPPPPPLPPPAPIPANAPASAAQAANANAAAQASAQAPAAAAAVAPQLQHKAQEAEIGRDRRPRGDDEYQFSAVRSRDDRSPAVTLAAAFVMAAAVGGSQVRRQRTQQVHVRR